MFPVEAHRLMPTTGSNPSDISFLGDMAMKRMLFHRCVAVEWRAAEGVFVVHANHVEALAKVCGRFSTRYGVHTGWHHSSLGFFLVVC
jgi:hypothetical protein